MSEKKAPIPEWRVQLEKELVGALLIHPDRLQELVGVLASGHLSTLSCRHTLAAMYSLLGQALPVELVTVWRELEARKCAADVGGRQGLAEIACLACNVANIRPYAGIILDEERRQRVGALASRIAMGARLDDELLAELQSELVVPQRDGDLLGQHVKALADRAAAGMPLDHGVLATPWRDLNDCIVGMAPGSLTLVAARPGRGKTVFLTDCARWVARDGSPVLFFSLEMAREGLLTRMLAAMSGIDHSRIRCGRIGSSEAQSLTSAADQIAAMPLVINDGGGHTINKIGAIAKRQKQDGGLALIVVDYAQLVSDPRAERRIEELSAVSRGLKAMAKELQVPVLAAAQLNREAERERPRISSIRECGQFEADADTILMLWADDEQERSVTPTIEVIVGKNRQGPGGYAKLLFQKPHCRMVQGLEFAR